MNDEVADKKQLLADAVAKARAGRKPDEGLGLSKAGGPALLKPEDDVKILGPQDVGQPGEGKNKGLFGGLTKPKKPTPGRGIPEDPTEKLDQLISQMTESGGGELSLEHTPAPAVIEPAGNQNSDSVAGQKKPRPQIMGYRNHKLISEADGNRNTVAKDINPRESKKEQVVTADLGRKTDQRKTAMASNVASRKQPVRKERPAAATIPIDNGSPSYQTTMPVYNPPARFRKNAGNTANDGTLKFR